MAKEGNGNDWNVRSHRSCFPSEASFFAGVCTLLKSEKNYNFMKPRQKMKILFGENEAKMRKKWCGVRNRGKRRGRAETRGDDALLLLNIKEFYMKLIYLNFKVH